MNPAERLRAAADRLETLDHAATPGTWTMFEEHGRDHTDEGWSYIGVQVLQQSGQGALIVAQCQDPLDRVENPQADAELIAALRPLAPWAVRFLRDAAAWLDRHPEVDGDTDALALADAILGGAS